jgi:hypothetical protein
MNLFYSWGKNPPNPLKNVLPTPTSTSLPGERLKQTPTCLETPAWGIAYAIPTCPLIFPEQSRFPLLEKMSTVDKLEDLTR